MQFGLFEILQLIGALGFFIFGMKIMSEGIQKVAGQNLRNILGAMTRNKFLGVLTGFSVTSIIQSSSATTVMVVSFVNAGLLSLKQAIGVIMGANIGTTITALLIASLGFGKLNLASYSLVVIAFGFPMLFAKKDRMKSTGEFLIGFALLFMGLAALKDTLPDKEVIAGYMDGVNNLKDSLGIFAPAFFVIIGTLVTVVLQSSSAAMTLTLALCDKGIIGFDMAAAIVLGENIGTTITANLAALIANVHAKRAARAHFIFNVVGVVWMLIIFPLYLKGIAEYLVETGQPSPFEEPSSIKWGLTLFHITFNIINTSVLIWFVNRIEKLVIKMTPSKGGEDEQSQLEYITSGLMSTPELSVIEAKKEIARFGKLVVKMHGMLNDLLQDGDGKKSTQIFERIKKYEDLTDKVEIEIADYLRSASQGELSEETSIQIRSMLSIINDLERIGDIYYQMSKVIERKNEEKIYFTPDQRSSIKEIMNLVESGLEIMLKNLNSTYENVKLTEAREIENEIDQLRDKLRTKHLKAVENKKYHIKSGMVYSDMYSSCEKIGDHIINVTEAVCGQV